MPSQSKEPVDLMAALEESLKTETRKCPWCNETVRERQDGALFIHQWDVRQSGDEPVMERCVGSGTTVANAIDAGWRPEEG